MYELNDKVKTWIPIEEIEPQAILQIEKLARMPIIYKWVGVMPDCHLGKGATVGSVIPTQGAIIPAAVGVDIGCSMRAVKFSLTKNDLPEDLSDIRVAIEKQVPLSAGKYNSSIKQTAVDKIAKLTKLAEENNRLEFYNKISKNTWTNQLGSLGSGNHFIEITLDEDDNVWGFLHSGSRGIGNKIAMYHIKIAQEQMKKYHIQLEDSDLAYLSMHTPEFDDYLIDLKWAQTFALYNTQEMMDRVVKLMTYRFPDLEVLEEIVCQHNFTQWEHHMGQNVLISRKGAIEAREGQLGLIPGSMGTRSYVVRGKGCIPAFNTAPHGAGRRLSRGAARREFTMEDFDRDLKGIEVRRTEAFLDELPGAYKDIDTVMENAKELVEVVHEFRQVLNVKGD